MIFLILPIGSHVAPLTENWMIKPDVSTTSQVVISPVNTSFPHLQQHLFPEPINGYRDFIYRTSDLVELSIPRSFA